MEQKEKIIYITDKSGVQLAQLSSRDGITDCKITDKQGGEISLNFTISVLSEKYKYISNAENLFIADNYVFTQLYDGDTVEESKTSNNENTANINLVGIHYLLGKQYVTAYNSSTTYDHIDNTMVVILSGGLEAMNVDGVKIEVPYEKGTAAYALYSILYNTDWSVGTVDVDDKFDLETEKKSILENINEIVNLWGGILIFDTLNKTVSLRSEEKYKPYNGFSVRYNSNETALTRTINKNIVTRLLVYGKDGLNISRSNEGKEYLENYSYTSTPLYGLMENSNLTTAGDLIVWGTRELKKIAVPQVSLKVSLVDLSKINGGISFETNDMVDVIDEVLSEEQYQARVIEKQYDFYQPWNVTVTLGDDVEKLAAKVKYAIENADTVNSLINLMNVISSDNVEMADGSRRTMTSYVQLTNAALEAGFKVIGVDGYERTGKTVIDIDGITVYNGGISIQDGNGNTVMYMDVLGNIVFTGDLYGATGTFAGELSAATGTFAGELSAATGSFSGTITAAEGSIGGWRIDENGLYSQTDGELDYNIALLNTGVITAASGNFEVDEDGFLTAMGASIWGSFDAGGETGSIHIGDDGISISYIVEDSTGDGIFAVVTGVSAMEITENTFKYLYTHYDQVGQVSGTEGIEYSNGTLKVSGEIHAGSGSIGGWDILSDSIRARNGSMVINADGTISGVDNAAGTVSGKMMSTSGNERTVMTGGAIEFYLQQEEIDPETGEGTGNFVWVKEGKIYTNEELLAGGVVISSIGARAIGFAADGQISFQFQPAGYENNPTGLSRFIFGSGSSDSSSKIYPNFIETGYVNEANPEWYSSVSVSNTNIVFTSGNRKDSNDEFLTYTYRLTRDNGKITSITDSGGHTTTITRS